MADDFYSFGVGCLNSLGHRERSIATPIIYNDHFPIEQHLAENLRCFLYHSVQILSFVESRENNAYRTGVRFIHTRKPE